MIIYLASVQDLIIYTRATHRVRHYPKIELEFRHFERFGQMDFVENLNMKVSSYLAVIKYSKRFNYTLFKYIVTETTYVSLIF